MEPLRSAQLEEPWPDWSGVEPMHPAPEEHLEQHDRDRRLSSTDSYSEAQLAVRGRQY